MMSPDANQNKKWVIKVKDQQQQEEQLENPSVNNLNASFHKSNTSSSKNWSSELKEELGTSLEYFFGDKPGDQHLKQPTEGSKSSSSLKGGSQPSRGSHHSVAKTNCTAVNDKITSESKYASVRKLTSYRLTKGSPDVKQPYRVSSYIKNSLKRTLSLQASSKHKRVSCASKELKTNDYSSRVKHAKSSGNLTSHLMKAGKSIKCLLSSNGKRIYSWSNGFKVSSSVFTVCTVINVVLFVLLDSVALAAPIPAPKLQPIWLLDGLISLDSNPIDNELDLQAASNQSPSLAELIIPDEELVQTNALDFERAGANIPSRIHQADESVSYETSKPITFRRTESSYPTIFDQYLSIETPETLEQQKDELVWLQRRRLDRDRALEPPPWFRVQPTRRGGLTLMEQPETESDSSISANAKPSESALEEVGLDMDNLVVGRQARNDYSRGSSDGIYEEIIKHLVDQALEDSSLLDQLYEEFDLKVKNQPSRSSSRLQQQNMFGPSLAGDLDALKLARLQKQGTTDKLSNDPSSQEALTQESDTDATLVVVGDEVSSGDDVTSVDSNTNLRSFLRKAGFTDPNPADESNQNDDFGYIKISPSIVDSHSLQADPIQSNKGAYFRTHLVGKSAGLLAEPSMQTSEVNGANLFPDSFHVLEDVDKMDLTQDLIKPTEELQEISEVPENHQKFSTLQSNWLMKPEQSFADPTDSFTTAWKRNNAIFSEQQSTFMSPPQSKSSWKSLLDSTTQYKQLQLRDQLALKMSKLGYLSRKQLTESALKLKNHIEDSIGIPRSSVVGLYPLNNEELLMKLDLKKLSKYQIWNMMKNYGFVRGYIVASWRNGSKQSPLPLLSAILRELASRYGKGRELVPETEALTGFGLMAGTGSSSSQLSPQLFNEFVNYQMDGVKWPSNLFTKPMIAAYLEAILLERSKLAVETAAAAARLTKAEKLPIEEKAHRWFNLDTHTTYLLALIAALLCTFIVVKLLARSTGARNLRDRLIRSGSFKSLWSSHSDVLSGNPATGKEAEAGNLRSAPPSYSSSAESYESPGKDDGKKEMRGFAQLSHRLNVLLKRQEKNHGAENGSPIGISNNGKNNNSKSNEIDEDVLVDEDECTEVQRESRFRSSRSYIRSLVEVLSRSRVALSMSPLDSVGNRLVKDDAQTITPSVESQVQVPVNSGNSNRNSPPNSHECSIAQMDISGAHLILDYMEKHLEDKERLKREWLALNGRPGKPKLAQVLLQRLARVALSEECRATRNRNPQVVPFDRNRVKLGGGWIGPPGDYINASYIHDDDLRRPTHIIAQGPTELTSGHFWQMVWEQGVSVIVMLTRLNENGTRMCHCYWPANSLSCTTHSAYELLEGEGSAPTSPSSGARQVAMAGGEQSTGMLSPSLSSGSPAPEGRRVSVTSVFSNLGGKPIVANGDLANNVLYFDAELPEKNKESSNSVHGDSLEQLATASDVSSTGEGGKAMIKLEVHLVSEHVSSCDYLVRNMYLINRNTCETRTVTQFHYLDWLENGVPSNVRNFLEFRRKVHKSYRNLKTPILVHCSDGAGRSGTYTLIDIILERIRSGAKEIDPRATLEHLRDQRMGLCASQSQFEFVLVALAAEIQIILDALPH